jgi:hypothetical protein
MKTAKTIISSILFGLIIQASCFAECETNTFIEAVNTAWSSTNYTLLEQILTNRVAECTNDILAKGLLYEYYDDVCIDFHKARSAAFIMATSNRMPSEVIHKRAPLESAIFLVEMPIPTNFPADQSKTPVQMEHMHQWNPETFPYLRTYQSLMFRIEAIETEQRPLGYFDPLNRD